MIAAPKAEQPTTMLYYPNPAAALRVVEDRLPSWGREGRPLAAALGYFEAVPVDFSVFGFGLEYHLGHDRIDAGVALPLSRGRSELLVENLVELRERLAADDFHEWPGRVLAPAERAAALAPLDARLVQAFCLCMDGSSLGERRCPDLIYLSLRDLHRLRDPSQLVWSPAIARLIAALYGEREPPGLELLARVAGLELPTLRLAHVGVARSNEAQGALKPYFHGALADLLALIRALPRVSGFDEPEWFLQALAEQDPDAALTLLLDSRPSFARVDIEIPPGSLFAAALGIASRRHGVALSRARELEQLAAAGCTRRTLDGWAPVAIQLSHLKLSLRAGRPPSWKTYFVVRQAG